MEKINIAALAEMCKVSPSTVSRVLNDKSNVKPETREMILEAAARLNYSPQQTARREIIPIIATMRSQMEPPSWFATVLLNALINEIDEAGFTPRLVTMAELNKIKPNFTMAAVNMAWTESEQTWKQLTALDLPMININIMKTGFHCVCFDHAEATSMAVKYLAAHGHRRIAHLDVPFKGWGTIQRRLGFEMAMNELNLPVMNDMFTVCDSSASMSRDLLAKMLDNFQPTAIVSLHEDWIMPLYSLLQSLGLKIGEDISIITSELPHLCQYLYPGITTVAQDFKQMAKAVVEHILLMRDKPEMARRTISQVMECHFIERQSVKDMSNH